MHEPVRARRVVGLALGAVLMVSCHGWSAARPLEPAAPELWGLPQQAPATPAVHAPQHQSACKELPGGAWPRAAAGQAGIAHTERADGQAYLAQTMIDGRSQRLRFLGTHVFDLLDKLAHEGGPDEAARRRLICALLNDVAKRSAPVVRIWGSLKHTGKPLEIRRSAAMLQLLLDENARRQHPLRFVVTLLNHQAGYGAPDPHHTLDEQAEDSPWHARAIYLQRSWRMAGTGLLRDRMLAFTSLPQAGSPYVLAWELVNELDSFGILDGASWREAAALQLRDRFLIPAAVSAAKLFPQLLVIGELRGPGETYSAFVDSLLMALPAALLRRLIWTTHVYAVREDQPPATGKLDRDRALARRHGLPLLIGELGQKLGTPTVGACPSGSRHDLSRLLQPILDRRLEAVLFWGEGRCPLELGDGRRMAIGAGGDSAELATDDDDAHETLLRARTNWPPP